MAIKGVKNWIGLRETREQEPEAEMELQETLLALSVTRRRQGDELGDVSPHINPVWECFVDSGYLNSSVRKIFMFIPWPH